MKPRPRKAENRVAEELNKVFSDLPITPFERIPVLGRTGPDLTINELGLVIDVKSRKECPKRAFLEPGAQGIARRPEGLFPGAPDTLNVFGLSDVRTLNLEMQSITQTKLLYGYWTHMHEWVREQGDRDLLTAIVIHRPGMPYGSSMVIMDIVDKIKLIKKIERSTDGQ